MKIDKMKIRRVTVRNVAIILVLLISVLLFGNSGTPHFTGLLEGTRYEQLSWIPASILLSFVVYKFILEDL